MGPQRMYGLTPWVRRLLVANLLVFLIQSTLLTSPSFVGAFGFSPAHAWQYPWTFITYMFLHAGIPHILFNMLMLFVFGSSVEDRMGGRMFVLFYLLCGIGGAASSFILRQLVPVSQIIGASGAVLGVAVAFAWYWPDHPVFVFPLPDPVPAKWLVTFLVALDLVLALIGASDGIAHLAHLGGVGTALLYLKGQDWCPTRARTPRSIACSTRSSRAAWKVSRPPNGNFSPKSAAGCARRRRSPRTRVVKSGAVTPRLSRSGAVPKLVPATAQCSSISFRHSSRRFPRQIVPRHTTSTSIAIARCWVPTVRTTCSSPRHRTRSRSSRRRCAPTAPTSSACSKTWTSSPLPRTRCAGPWSCSRLTARWISTSWWASAPRTRGSWSSAGAGLRSSAWSISPGAPTRRRTAWGSRPRCCRCGSRTRSHTRCATPRRPAARRCGV